MAKFKCNKCGEVKNLDHYTMRAYKGKVISDDAMCCHTHMERTYQGKGFGTIKKGPNGTVKSK